MSTEIINVTEETFQEIVLNPSTLVLVDFYADWCEPCKIMAPKLQKVADYVGDKVKVVKADVDYVNENENGLMHQHFIKDLSIKGIPALIMFQDGKVLPEGVSVGAKEPVEIMRWIDKTAGLNISDPSGNHDFSTPLPT